MAELSVYDNDPTLYLFTSLTAGSSHIVTATSRIETILKANKIPFKGVDTATDDLARKLYGRRGEGKKLPLLVKEGYVLGGIEEIEEWNEYDELEEALGVTPVAAPIPAKPAPAQSGTASTSTDKQKENTPATSSEQNLAIRQLGAEAAKVAASKKPAPSSISTTNPLLAEKAQSPAASAPNSASVLSPRSIPLPFSPNPAKSTGIDKTAERTAAEEHNIPKLSSKPVHSPPSMHADAANPKLAVAPLSATRRPPPSPLTSPLSPSSGSDGSSVKEFHGSRVGTASEEEIKQIEKEQAIAEVSSEEEEDSEEEIKQIEKKQAIAEVSSDDDDDDEEEEEEEEEEDSDEENEVSKNEVKSKDGKVLEQSEKPKDKANEGKEK